MTSRSLIEASGPEAGIGFVGMMFVVLVSSLGAVMVVMLLTSGRATSQNAATQKKATVLLAAINRYKTHRAGASWPASLDRLVTTDGTACAADTSSVSATWRTIQGWCGPYVDVPFSSGAAANDFKTDGWGTTFTYAAATGVVTSCGPDRTCGNADDLSFTP
jgi:hypothetical protein